MAARIALTSNEQAIAITRHGEGANGGFGAGAPLGCVVIEVSDPPIVAK
jgi:hypothetical protein